jgi:RimJ/RimL family protein N-acetyltransferase
MRARHLRGKLVHLLALKSDSDREMTARRPLMSGAWRLLDSADENRHGPDRSAAEGAYFRVRALAGDQPLGQAGLFGICRIHDDAWIDVSLRHRQHWDRPYGADTLQVMLRYAFEELDLRRVALGVFEYDAGRMRVYEAAGFTIEGRVLEESDHGTRRAGLLMGIQRETWQT